LEYLGEILHSTYRHVASHTIKFLCNLEMVVRMAVADFKWNDPNV